MCWVLQDTKGLFGAARSRWTRLAPRRAVRISLRKQSLNELKAEDRQADSHALVRHPRT